MAFDEADRLCATLVFCFAKLWRHPSTVGSVRLRRSDGRLEYSRPSRSSAVELGTVSGLDVALPTHFHEDQITFVLSGRRRFIIGHELVDIGPDEGSCIPAGVPHRSLAETAELFCINIYTPRDECCHDDLISGLARFRRRKGASELRRRNKYRRAAQIPRAAVL
jgi:mannose-6-phosphate isomerase-like protein (cupin superfamily)